jgi:murein DD-endopeptidase MepM/ murein hydrolase activator NlpD
VRTVSPREATRHRRRRSASGVALIAVPALVLYAGAAVATGGVPDVGTADAGKGMVSESRLGLTFEPPSKRAKERGDSLIWPVRGEVTGRFGEFRGGHQHAGLDVPAPSGTPIRAAADGVVVMREVQDGYGKYTCIAHETFSTCYAHQSRFRTKQGAKVTQGQVIGHVGNTGNSPVEHLHFEVRSGRRPWGKPMDPSKYLPRR